jgi:hypothetical protein
MREKLEEETGGEESLADENYEREIEGKPDWGCMKEKSLLIS